MCFWGKVYDSLKGDKRHVFENRGPIVGCSSSAVVPCWGCCCVMADCVCVCAFVRIREGGRGSQSLPFQTVSLCQTWLRLWHNTAQRGHCLFGCVRFILFQSSLEILLLRGG